MKKMIPMGDWHRMDDREKLFYLKDDRSIELIASRIPAIRGTKYGLTISLYIERYDQEFAKKYRTLL